MFLGIDLGTSEVKALLLAEGGEVVATARAPLEVRRPRPHWSEQDPEDWWTATLTAVDRLRATRPLELAGVRGLGLSGQMHGAAMLDATDRPLRPAILWNDTRAAEECRELLRREPDATAITANRAMPGFTAPKILWVATHEPEVFARTAKILLPKDFLRLRLTGDYLTDASDAAGTLWLDVARRDWSDAMLGACGLTRAHVPAVLEGSAPGGTLRGQLAARWGMAEPVVVAGGGGDNAASAVGIGAIAPGTGFVSLGTSGVIFVVNECLRPNPASAVHAFCHALPGRWHQMSVMLSAASCLRWLARATGAPDEETLVTESQRLTAEERRTAPIFLPYLSGERTPHDDPDAQGVLFGLRHGTGRGALAYAVLEGVAFGLADGLAALQAAGTRPGPLSLVGGGSRSAAWAALVADALGVSLRMHAGAETGAALGAARLGWLACGAREEDVCVPPPVEWTVEPRPDEADRGGRRLEMFRALYPAVRSLRVGVPPGTGR